MKPRNTIMALVAKNDPTRYHTRSVEAEYVKIQRNRARRRSKERKEIQSNCQGESQQLHCGSGLVLPPPTTLHKSDLDLIIAEVNAWNREFSKRVRSVLVII